MINKLNSLKKASLKGAFVKPQFKVMRYEEATQAADRQRGTMVNRICYNILKKRMERITGVEIVPVNHPWRGEYFNMRFNDEKKNVTTQSFNDWAGCGWQVIFVIDGKNTPDSYISPFEIMYYLTQKNYGTAKF